MSYIVPAVQVYQDLENAGGVANSTPDLDACIIGPLYNVRTYIPGDVSSQISTAAHSTVTTTGSISSSSKSLTVVSTGGLNEGDSILVFGAGSSGSNLQAVITDITGNVVTLDTAAGTTVTDATVTKSAFITNSAVSNTFAISGTKAGQDVDADSVKVWVDSVTVETQVTGCEGFYSDTTLTVVSASTTGTVTNPGDSTMVVASASKLFIGDSVTIVGAGTAGADLTVLITDIVGTTITFTPAAVLAVTGAAVTKVIPTNLNSTTNTLRVEPGDTAVVSYTNTSSAASVFTSEVKSVVTSSGLNGLLVTVDVVDSLPSDLSYQTTGSVSGATLTVASATGITIGKKLIIREAASDGSDLLTTVSNVVGLTITVSPAAGTNVSNKGVIVLNTFSVSFRKLYEDQLVPKTKPISGGSNYTTTNVSTNGQITIQPNPELVYGKIQTGNVYIGYRALRHDLAGRVLTFENIDDLVGVVEDLTDQNPIGLGVKLALANTTGRVKAITVESNDLTGYLDALEISEGERLYYLTPLTQDQSILAAFKAHVVQMSTPENASWRVALVNTEMPLISNIGPYSEDYLDVTGSNSVTIIAGKYVLTASNGNFISNGVEPGDIVNVVNPTLNAGAYEVLEVVSNQQLVIDYSTVVASGIQYYISRAMSKAQTAAAVKAVSEVFNSNRVWHIQPDIVGIDIDGVTKYLPGYYLCCALAGMGAGFPVQQGFTNIGAAGIVDLKHSNFYFSKSALNDMAGGGTCLFVQETQGGIPYCRHELTTDMTVLEYREMLIVKNWDFVSYHFFDKLKGFIGSWNITTDTINTVRRTIIASAELLKSKKLPKIGPPLLKYSITKLEQNAVNKDNLDAIIPISVVDPLNYLNVHLVI